MRGGRDGRSVVDGAGQRDRPAHADAGAARGGVPVVLAVARAEPEPGVAAGGLLGDDDPAQAVLQRGVQLPGREPRDPDAAVCDVPAIPSARGRRVPVALARRLGGVLRVRRRPLVGGRLPRRQAVRLRRARLGLRPLDPDRPPRPRPADGARRGPRLRPRRRPRLPRADHRPARPAQRPAALPLSRRLRRPERHHDAVHARPRRRQHAHLRPGLGRRPSRQRVRRPPAHHDARALPAIQPPARRRHGRPRRPERRVRPPRRRHRRPLHRRRQARPHRDAPCQHRRTHAAHHPPFPDSRLDPCLELRPRPSRPNAVRPRQVRRRRPLLRQSPTRRRLARLCRTSAGPGGLFFP
mmetsp:Transcript_22802/g.71459  ORF Transcript_22802/g.71459 Transcript_22802/m.71459 type:complete len:353 (+) Transcript_22802:231-1289(+)